MLHSYVYTILCTNNVHVWPTCLAQRSGQADTKHVYNMGGGAYYTQLLGAKIDII